MGLRVECGERGTHSDLMWCGISPPAVLSCFILFGNISKLSVTLPSGSSLLLLFGARDQNEGFACAKPTPPLCLTTAQSRFSTWLEKVSVRCYMLATDTRKCKGACLRAEADACPFWWPRGLHLCVLQSFTLNSCVQISTTVVRSRHFTSVCLWLKNLDLKSSHSPGSHLISLYEGGCFSDFFSWITISSEP